MATAEGLDAFRRSKGELSWLDLFPVQSSRVPHPRRHSMTAADGLEAFRHSKAAGLLADAVDKEATLRERCCVHLVS